MEAGLSLAPLSLSMFAVALLAGRKPGNRRPANIVLAGFVLTTVGIASIIPVMPRAESGWALIVPLLIAGSGLGLLVSQLNNYTLSPIEEERVSEAAGVNSASGSFGLSFGLAMAGGLMLAVLSLSFTHMVDNSTVIPDRAATARISTTLEDNAEVMSNTQLDALLDARAAGGPGGDPAHQHRRAEPLAAGRAARAGARGPDRPVQRLPHAPPPRHRARGQPRRPRPRLTRGREFPQRRLALERSCGRG